MKLNILSQEHQELQNYSFCGPCTACSVYFLYIYSSHYSIVILLFVVFPYFPPGLFTRFKKSIFRFIRQLPIIKGKVQDEIDKSNRGMEDAFHKGAKGQDYLQALPAKGLTEVTHLW